MKAPNPDAPRPKKPAKTEHYGFREDGSSFKSDKPVDNACTRAVWFLVRMVRERLLRPDELCFEIAHKPDFVQSMFASVIPQWATLSNYWQWRLASVGTPAASTLKYRGAQVPMQSDRDTEATWTALCEHAARIHGEPPLAALAHQGTFSAFIDDLKATRTVSPEVEADILAAAQRQIAAAREAGLL